MSSNLQPRAHHTFHLLALIYNALPCPRGQSFSLFCKRKLSVYNLSIYELDLPTSDVVFNIWTEQRQFPQRGAKQIARCILHFIDEQVEKGVYEIHRVSDICTGPNRSRSMATMLWHDMNKLSFPQEIEYCFWRGATHRIKMVLLLCDFKDSKKHSHIHATTMGSSYSRGTPWQAPLHCQGVDTVWLL